MNDQDTAYDRFDQRYQDDQVPWDDTLPPPEIMTTAERLSPGRALDLGCGYGRAAIYLAEKGWHAVGVDFIPKAIAVASERAAEHGVAERAQFYQASADDLGILDGEFDLAIDVGCMHSFTEEMLTGYGHELRRLLKPGATYMLFAHLKDDTDEQDVDTDSRPRGIDEVQITSLMENGFRLEAVEYGLTQVEDNAPWRSAWYWFKRLPA